MAGKSVSSGSPPANEMACRELAVFSISLIKDLGMFSILDENLGVK